MYDFFEQATRTLTRAGELADVDPCVMEMLAGPERLIAFRIPVKMDDGSRRIFDAYRVRHNHALGPSRDGTRISPTIDLDEVKALGLIMSIKHAAGRIPAGGGKGGIAADPAEMSQGELERLCRGFMRNLQPAGPAVDVPGADIGTDLQSMAWMLDEYEQITGRHAPMAVNDKPPVLGGSLGGYEATGKGVHEVFRAAAESMGMAPDSVSIAIQGFGQVGSVAARAFHRAGCRVIAVSEKDGGVFNRDGLDIEALQAHRESTGALADFPGSQPVSNAELLELDCDVVMPAAVQGVITADNAPRIRPRMLLEAANGPTTLEADAILRENGVTVVPDVLANAGSVQVCQMERSQGLADDWWDMETIDRLRRERLERAYREAAETAAEYDTDSVRLGAWINAIKRMEEAIHWRGWA